MYRGYSSPIYEDWVRSSQYVAARDGTELAVDIYRPAVKGEAVDKAYPVVWEFTPYRRAFYDKKGKLILTAERQGMLELTRYGYVIAVADTRGMGASYGSRRGMSNRTEAADGYDLTEWFAKQPWCNGKVGMWGASYNGSTQMSTASMMPPHLKAIFPEVTEFDKYDMQGRGGLLGQFGTRPDDPYTADLITAPVDEDTDQRMLKEAVEQHKYNVPMAPVWEDMPYRDSVSPILGTRYWMESSPSTYLAQLQRSGVASYFLGGWHDEFRRDVLVMFANMRNSKVIVGPWGHVTREGFDIFAERLRFYDFWLKGIQNGIMKEPPIHYFVQGAPRETEWRAAWKWPLPEEIRRDLYLRSRGELGDNSSTDLDAKDDYRTDYSVTCGQVQFLWEPCVQDQKALTYTTAPLATDIDLTGHPIVHLWISMTADDGDFFTYLEDVDPSGGAKIITYDGRLKASHRALANPPYNLFRLPWHPSRERDIMPLKPGEPSELIFDLLPTSYVISQGHRVRIAMTCADPRQRKRTELSPPPVVGVYRDKLHASYISLPVINQRNLKK